MKDFIQRLPIDIILYIIPYTYNLQNKNLLNDIRNYTETRSLLMKLYYEYWIIDAESQDSEEDTNWLINDIMLYTNNDKATMYGYVDNFYNIFKRNVSLHTNNNIDKYIINLYKKTAKTQKNIVLGLLTMSETVAAIAEDKQHAKNESLPIAPPIITKGSITIHGKVISYTATTGYMKITDEEGNLKATMFYTAYTKDNSSLEQRPITYAFNGGPGSSSVWLHMGALGPKRVVLSDKGDALKPPGTMVDNEFTWLEFTDLVFIDPVGTGYSRPAKDEKKEQFHGIDEDIASVGNFIRLYTTQNKRWVSPKFLAGESYGTTRAAGLANHLADRHGMYVNGIVLISMVLDFQTLRFSTSNELPNVLFLPTYAATAMYYNKLAADLQINQEKTLQEIRNWALGEYFTYLAKGDAVDESTGERVNPYLAFINDAASNMSHADKAGLRNLD